MRVHANKRALLGERRGLRFNNIPNQNSWKHFPISVTAEVRGHKHSSHSRHIRHTPPNSQVHRQMSHQDHPTNHSKNCHNSPTPLLDENAQKPQSKTESIHLFNKVSFSPFAHLLFRLQVNLTSFFLVLPNFLQPTAQESHGSNVRPNALPRYVFLTSLTQCRSLSGHRPLKLTRLFTRCLERKVTVDSNSLGELRPRL